MADGSLSKEFERASKTDEMALLIRNLSVDAYSNSAENEFDEDLTKIEVRLKEISLWIEDSLKDLENLPKNPTSFDEILATIEPERTNKVRNLRFELSQLKERRNNMSEQHDVLSQVKKFQDRLFGIVQQERAVKNELKVFGEASKTKISMAAFMFKKRIRHFINEYWDDAKEARKALDNVQKRCGRRLPDDFDVERMLAGALDDRKTIVKLDYTVKRLARLGGFIGRINNQEGVKDISFDSMDLKKVYETTTEKLDKRVKLLEKKIEDSKRENEYQKLKQYDDEHKKEYMDIYMWTDEKLGEASNLIEEAKKLMRSQGRKKEQNLAKVNDRMKEIVDVEIPIKEIAISENMTPISNLLQDKNYKRTQMVKEREGTLRVTLSQLRDKILGEQNKLFYEQNQALIKLRAKSIREVVKKVYSVDLKEDISFLIADYADTRPTVEVKKKRRPAPKVEKKTRRPTPKKKKPAPERKTSPERKKKSPRKEHKEEIKTPEKPIRKAQKTSPTFGSARMKGSTIRTRSAILKETPVEIIEQAAREDSPVPPEPPTERKSLTITKPAESKPPAPKEEQKQEKVKIVQRSSPVIVNNLPPSIAIPDQPRDSLPPVQTRSQVLSISRSVDIIKPAVELEEKEPPQQKVLADFSKSSTEDFQPEPDNEDFGFKRARASELAGPVQSLDTFLPSIFDSPQPPAVVDHHQQMSETIPEVHPSASVDDQSTLISQLTEELGRLHSEMDKLREQVKTLTAANKSLEEESSTLALENFRMRRLENQALAQV